MFRPEHAVDHDLAFSNLKDEKINVTSAAFVPGAVLPTQGKQTGLKQSSRLGISKSQANRPASDARRLYALSDVTNSKRTNEQPETSFRDGRITAAIVNTAHPQPLQPSTAGNLRAERPQHAQKRQDTNARQQVNSFQSATGLLRRDQEVFDIDAPFHGDVHLVSEYAQANAVYMHERESQARPSCSYMESVQRDINSTMRGVLVDWLVEVADEYKLVTETLYLTVAYIDSFLSKRSVSRNQLQLVGVTCMRLAAKFEEIYPPPLEKFSYITDHACSEQQIIDAEAEVLQAINFNLAVPTPKVFLQRFLRAAHITTKLEHNFLEPVSRYILELTLIDYATLAFLPSMIAASALFLARVLICDLYPPNVGNASFVLWTTTLEHYAFYQPKQMRACVLHLHRLLLANGNSSSQFSAIFSKYEQARWMQVAKLRVSPTIDEAVFAPYHSVTVPGAHLVHNWQ